MADNEDLFAYTLIAASPTAMISSIYGGTTESLGGDSEEVATSASEDPGSATAVSVGVSIVATSCGGPDAVIEVFFKNQVPYTVTEKRAEQVYGTLHTKRKTKPEKPALIAESGDAAETISMAFCNARGDGVLEQLELFEELLESVADNQNLS